MSPGSCRPPRTPRHNPAAQAGIGSLKTRVCHEACRHGRLGQWTRDDGEAVRPQINDTQRPVLREAGTKRIAAKLGLESTLRPHGRPRKKRAEDDS